MGKWLTGLAILIVGVSFIVWGFTHHRDEYK